MEQHDLCAAHEASRFNREGLGHDKKCGCFFCLKIYSPSEIEEWSPEEYEGEEVTAICPHCGIDSVLGESSGFPITQDFLKVMHHKYFE